MTIKCPHCQRELDCDPSCVGVEVNCPVCNNIFIVPRPVAVIVSEQECNHSVRESVNVENLSVCGYPSWRIYILWFIIAILLIPLYGIGLFIILIIILSRYSTKYLISNNILTVRSGIILKSERSVMLKNIQKVDIHRTLGDLLTNCATVVVETSGKDSKITMPHLSNAKEVQKRLYNVQ